MAANSNSSSFLTSLLAVVATMAVFVILVYIAYGFKSDNAPVVVEPDNPPPSAATLRAQEVEVLTTYAWIDQEKGIVRIPVERATDLVIQELNQ